jgi:hypothetical protein
VIPHSDDHDPGPLRDDKTAKIGRMRRAKLQGRRLQVSATAFSHDQDPKWKFGSDCSMTEVDPGRSTRPDDSTLIVLTVCPT